MRKLLELRYIFFVLVVLILLLTMVWASNSDPFKRREFTLKTSDGCMIKGIVVLPKPAAKYSVVVYVHGRGESLFKDGKSLRQIAELGLAAVGIEYDQTDPTTFDEQFLALQSYLGQQSWAQSNATAWVGFSLGAKWILNFILNHPERQPQLLALLSGGSVPDLDSKISDHNSRSGPFIRCPVLLIHGENDGTFPLDDTKRLADVLQADGTSVNLRILRGHGHTFGDDHDAVIRAAVEYCRAHLPLTDYTATLSGCQMNQVERQRFNIAMQRAGSNRWKLWKAVVSSREPERHTIMTVIGRLEDYDLAHMTAGYLKKEVHVAWQARRTYPWCRDTPIDIFEKVTANPRIYEEPIENWQLYFSKIMRREVKYCRTTQEASDAIWRWMWQMVQWNGHVSGAGKTPLQVLHLGRSNCLGMAVLYTALCRSVGLAERPLLIIWQDPELGSHDCTEVWSPEEKRWHELDSTADNRTYNTGWVLRVPKAMIFTPTGERGDWRGTVEYHWGETTNIIGRVYPSGTVKVKVLDHGIAAANQVIGIEVANAIGTELIANARTDANGLATVALGQSAKYPYRLFVEQSDDTDWQWLDVQSNKTYEITFDLQNKRPFHFSRPPSLIKTNLQSDE
jgi:dienelactone hydrolase